MKAVRPDFITSEQISRWDDNIKNDAAVQALMTDDIADPLHFKEMLYASLWLNESMYEMGFDELIIVQTSIILGQESAYLDPWCVAKILFDMYVKISVKIVN